MKKFQEALYKLAESDDQMADRAADLYLNSEGLDDAALAGWVAENADELAGILKLPFFEYKKPDDRKELMKEFGELRNAGITMFNGDKKMDVRGQEMKGLDDFMKAFGVQGSDAGEYTDKDRAAFTNPENTGYWGNRSANDMEIAASIMGYPGADEMRRELETIGSGFTRKLGVEGYDANGNVEYLPWMVSALKGFAAPRVKEAQLAGRDVSWQDVAGDMAELGLNFVPGVGLVGKGGKIFARLPAAGRMAGTGALFVGENMAVPFGTQALDAGLLYNPNTLGSPTSGLNPRSELDWEKMMLQAGGIAGAKGALKGGAMMGKNALEQNLGEKGGKSVFKDAMENLENIGSKTEDQIARRQAMLDRKAELARVRENVRMEGDRDIPPVNTEASVDDLVNAEDFRILTEEARRLAKSDAERKAYNQAAARQEARMKGEERTYSRDADGNTVVSEPVYREGGPLLVDGQPSLWINIPAEQKYSLGTYLKGAQGVATRDADQAVADAYRAANEAGAKDIAQLPNGKFVYADRVQPYGLDFRGVDYTVPNMGQPRSAEFFYKPALTPKGYAEPGVTILENGQAVKPVDRNQAVLDAIKKDKYLERSMNPRNNARFETGRDFAANEVFNVLAREGLVGNMGDFDEKRERALWNRLLMQTRSLTANSKIPPNERMANQSAVMNAMNYGLDGLPDNVFLENPRIYHAIAELWGVKGWKHPLESNSEVLPTNSTSTYIPESSSSAY